MLNSVQWWLQQTLDGLASPQMGNLQAVIQPPVDVEEASEPICYIWAADVTVDRQSAPRPKAWQNFNWSVDVAVMASMDLDDPTQDSAFPLLLDQIVVTLAQVAMPFVLTDPVTGFQTQILSLGEKLSNKYARVRIAAGPTGGALVKFGSELTLTVEEKVSFLSGYPYGTV